MLTYAPQSLTSNRLPQSQRCSLNQELTTSSSRLAGQQVSTSLQPVTPHLPVLVTHTHHCAQCLHWLWRSELWYSCCSGISSVPETCIFNSCSVHTTLNTEKFCSANLSKYPCFLVVLFLSVDKIQIFTITANFINSGNRKQ